MANKNPYQNQNNAIKECLTDIDMSRGLYMLNHIQSSDHTKDANTVLYAVGYTYREKRNIDNLSKTMGVEVKINRSTRKGLVLFLPIPAPRYFAIKIVEVGCVVDLFEKLDEYIRMELVLFNISLEQSFLHELENGSGVYPYESLKSDEQYFVYGIDCDNQESETGIMELVSCGKKTPKELTFFPI